MRARDVPRLGVAELPLAGSRPTARPRARRAQLALPLPARHPLGDVAQQRLAELAHRLRAEPVLAVGAALEVAAVAQRPLELLQRPGVDGRLGRRAAGPARRGRRRRAARRRRTARAGRRGRRAAARSCSTPVPSPSPSPSPPSNCSEPPQSSPGRSACRLASIRASCSISAGEPKACCESSISCCRCSGDIELQHPLRGGRALRERVEQLVDVLRVLGEELAVLGHEVVEVLPACRSPCWCFSSRSLRSESISLTAARSSSVAFSSASFMPANRWSSSSRPSRSLICS